MSDQTLNAEMLSEDEGRFLVRFARHTIAGALRDELPTEESVDPPTERLSQPGAAFVTLHTGAGALRGCIGSLMAHRPLIEDVRANALAAAFDDPRFPPLTLAELPNIVVEVSVLTTPKPLDYEAGQDLIEKLRPHVDGVVIQQGWHRATFLPQVWEQLPSPVEFLTNLCYKAGLPASTWRQGDLEVLTYRVQKFEEPT
ncbi:MAG: AmmeMemoRadiSam system protein A [Anaerolineae bacterium]